MDEARSPSADWSFRVVCAGCCYLSSTTRQRSGGYVEYKPTKQGNDTLLYRCSVKRRACGAGAAVDSGTEARFRVTNQVRRAVRELPTGLTAMHCQDCAPSCICLAGSATTMTGSSRMCSSCMWSTGSCTSRGAPPRFQI